MESLNDDSFNELASAFNRQFGVELTVDPEVHESGKMYVRHDAETPVRSTESVRINWLKRNANRFGFRFETPNRLAPVDSNNGLTPVDSNNSVNSDEPPWDDNHAKDLEFQDYDPKHTPEADES